jgi:hypothetical protein
MSTNPTWEKFQRATVTLARSGPIKDRLTDAYRSHLATVLEDELPVSLRADFRNFGRAVTRERPVLRGEDSFRATVRKMSCEEAEDLACSVVQMFSAMPRGAAPARTGKLPAQIVPLYIAEA